MEPVLGPAKPDPGDNYCYLPLYVFCGRHLLASKLRPANIDGSAGSIEEVARIVTQIRTRWPQVRILLRAASGFARDGLMTGCETNGVDFLFGLSRNSRLVGEIEAELAAAAERSQQTGKPARRFKDFAWRTRDRWSRQRRVVAKADGPKAKPTRALSSPRCRAKSTRPAISTRSSTAPAARWKTASRACPRESGGMPALYADRTPVQARGRLSAQTMRANQLRLWFASMAYVLVCALRRIALAHTQFARASGGTIRLKLLKIGALVRTSVRRIKLAMPSAFPYRAEYRAAHAALTAAATA